MASTRGRPERAITYAGRKFEESERSKFGFADESGRADWQGKGLNLDLQTKVEELIGKVRSYTYS
jgi:hypothetical protein